MSKDSEPSLVPGDKGKKLAEIVSPPQIANTSTQSLPRKRRLTSTVCEDFIRDESSSKKVFATCKYCNVRLAADSSKGTSHLNYHRNSCIQKRLKKGLVKDGGQMLINLDAQADRSKGVKNFKFDAQVSRHFLARMIIIHEYPFSIVQHVAFREFINSLNSQFKMVSKVTIRDTCMKLYETEKTKLYNTLDSISSKISITSDLWTSGQNKGYMSLTAHYIDSDWKLQKRILNFTHIPSPHTGVNIAERIFDKLLEWNIESKISSIVLDNCCTNDVVARELHRKLMSKGILPLNGSLFHVRCCAHILNLIVQDGLGEIAHVIEGVRNCVKYVKSSTGRKERFEEVVSQVRASQKQLPLDVPTRWNSTYLMLSTTLELRNAFTRMASRDKNFPMAFMDHDWDNMESVCTCLNLFYEATLVFSSTSRPTINDLFNHVATIEIHLKMWVKSDISFVASMAGKMLNKFQKYWGSTSKLLTLASMIDPRYKIALLSYYYPDIYGEESNLYIDEAKKTLDDLYKEYCSQSETSSSSVGVSTCESSGLEKPHDTFRPLLKKSPVRYREFMSSKGLINMKSDLEFYLDEAVIPVPLHESTDVLEWWKINQFKYPLVSRIARDFLSIPVSTVASEAAFSTGGRVIDQYRSRLKPKMVEALMCTQDWLRHAMKGEIDDIGFGALYSMAEVDFEDEDELED